ncbi:MAG: hypothetical protein EOP45_18165 [Sphingobacteriaceae bacterium]|nr:MAG: hypothetical protein EOP45_18165 [Sphingobacteriaceae bacterium]
MQQVFITTRAPELNEDVNRGTFKGKSEHGEYYCEIHSCMEHSTTIIRCTSKDEAWSYAKLLAGNDRLWAKMNDVVFLIVPSKMEKIYFVVSTDTYNSQKPEGLDQRSNIHFID